VTRRIQLVLLLTLVPLAAGCGSTGVRDAVSLDPVASAATRTSSTSSLRVAFDGSISGPWAGQRFAFSGNGIVDSAALTGEMHFRFDFASAARARLGANPTMDIVFESKHGLVMYMRSPLFARVVPGSKPWLKMDLRRLAALKGLDLNSLQQMGHMDPTQNLRFLTGAGKSRELGWDRVRGALTKHYALTIDLARLAQENVQLRKPLDQLRHLTGTKLPAEAWVDEQGLLRKLTLNFSVAQSQDGPIRMTVSEEFYGFGTHVHVAAPRASEVTDATQLLTKR
jgi:hypothetical protein